MHEILYHLPADAVVLDLGSCLGSFDAGAFPFKTVRVDLSVEPGVRSANFVQADAVRLPFRSAQFDAVICNHGLEHFVELKPALQEMGRVLKKSGALFVSVPDARTFHDRLYRKLTGGGGHVNLFDQPVKLARMLEWYAGVRHVATSTLYASFAFLNRRNARGPLPGKLGWFCVKREFPLALLSGMLRIVDRRLAKRTSVYGWSMYFGQVPETVTARPWTNVCIRCGQAHASAWLAETGAVKRRWGLFEWYLCPGCGAGNFYSRDEWFTRSSGG